MREILFRGKTEDGYWVKGNLIKNEDASFIAKTEAYSFLDYCMDCNVPFDGDNMHQVIPETVGQYTGFVDKNGKKIFEGDIVCMDDWIPPCMQVAYEQGAFYLAEIEKPVKYYGYIYYLNHGGKPNAKVVGNIYDDLSY